jgi:hypothetical protein
MPPDSPFPGRYLAFDLEISKSFPSDAADWRPYRPFGISCAATLTSEQELRLWYGRTAEGEPAAQMSRDEAIALVDFLQDAVASGCQIVTWNGLGFDFDILAEESGEYQRCREIAAGHIDMMFHVFCARGFPLALDKAAQGMRLRGKLPGMSGELAPILWAQGDYQKVLDYVAQDVDITLRLFYAGNQTRRLAWLSNRGRPQDLILPQGWLSVNQAMQLPLPDTSWMSNPWSRSKFTRWMEGEG